MIPHLPNTYTSPPGEWRYRVPETGQFFKGSNWPDIQSKLLAHYRATGYTPPDNLYDTVEAFICANEPGYCTGGEPVTEPFTKHHSFTHVLQGTKTLASWLLKGRPYVEQSQADARAKVCASCVFNTEPEGCSSCNSAVLKEAVMLVVGKRTTAYDSALRACRICGCQLKAKVHLPLDSITQHMPEDQQDALPDHCWIVNEIRGPHD